MTNAESTLTKAIKKFTQTLTGRNVSPHTITAYKTDLCQFIAYIADADISVIRPDQVTRSPQRVSIIPGR